MARSARRGAIAVLVVVGLLVAVGFGARAAYTTIRDRLLGDSCTVAGYQLNTDQASVASQMVGVVVRRGLPQRAAELVLAAAVQESKLRNIPAGQGDRDSVGVLQQRPSQGWGTAEQLSDVRYATGAFLDALVKVPNWQDDSLATVIQQVQVSADGAAYAQHAPEANALAAALTGATPAGLSCRFRPPSQVAPATTVASELAADLPVSTPRADGRTVTVDGAGWATAAWFVANADRLGIDRVAHEGKTWARDGGWSSSHAQAGSVVATLHG